MAGNSVSEGKAETYQWVLHNIDKDAQILDVGPGKGIYGVNLRSMGYSHIDAVEIEESYVQRFGQRAIYRDVFVADARSWEPVHDYDLVIFGDVLEHMPLIDALLLLNKYRHSYCVVSVPWMYKQGAAGGIEAERHYQDQLTPASVNKHYHPDLWLKVGEVVGVFVINPDPR